jgi:hypothetical protein
MRFMKILFVIIILCSSSTWASELVKLDAKIERSAKELILNVTLANTGVDDVYIPTFAGQLIDLRLDLWCSGKGIEIYPKYDVEWRREQAFIDYKWQLLKPGANMQVSVRLGEMMPSDPDNDQVAKTLVDELIFLGKGRAYVSAKARKSIPKLNAEDTNDQIYRTVTMFP